MDQIALKHVEMLDDAVMCDLLEHFLGLASHDNINAAPSTRIRPMSPERFNDE